MAAEGTQGERSERGHPTRTEAHHRGQEAKGDGTQADPGGEQENRKVP